MKSEDLNNSLSNYKKAILEGLVLEKSSRKTLSVMVGIVLVAVGISNFGNDSLASIILIFLGGFLIIKGLE